MLRTPGPSPFVGREQELARLHGCLAAAARGAGGVVLVSGGPGIGKTRLLAEFAAQAREGGSLVLIGHSYDGEGMPPYLPFMEALRGYIRSVDPNRLSEQLDSGAARLAPLLPELVDRLPHLPVDRAASADLDRFCLFEAVTDLLLAAARSAAGGLLLVLEDLHWADAVTLALLRHLAWRLPEGPLLLAATYRDLDLPRTHPLHAALAELTRQQVVGRLPLQRMDAPEVARLIDEMTGVPVSPPVAERIFMESEGNPFFVTELVRQLVNDGVDFGAEVAAAAGWGVPEGVRQVIGSRLARLREPAGSLLQAAAVLGAGIRYETLIAMTARPPDELLEALEELLGAGLLIERSGTYEFAHALIRQTVEATLSLPRRQRLHLQAAEALALVSVSRPGEHAAAIAGHYRLAGALVAPATLLAALRQAAAAASAVFAWEDAAGHLQTALALAIDHDIGGEALRCDLLLALGAVQNRGGDEEGALTTVQEALTVARRCGDGERLAHAVLSLVGRWVMDVPYGVPSRELLAEALEALDPAPSGLRVRLLARLATDLAVARVQLPSQPVESRLVSDAAVTMGRGLSDPAALVPALLAASLALGITRHVEQRIALAREAMQLSRCPRLW